MEKENPCQCLWTTSPPRSLYKYPGAAFSLECEVMLIFTSLDELSLLKACKKVYCQKVGRAGTLLRV